MPEDQSPTWLELERILPLKDAANVSSLSEDSLKRNHADKIIRLGPRRLGMRARDALMLGQQFVVIMFVMVTVVLAAHAATASATMTHKTDETAIFPFTGEIADLGRPQYRVRAVRNFLSGPATVLLCASRRTTCRQRQ
jgi:hypothetical protein